MKKALLAATTAALLAAPAALPAQQAGGDEARSGSWIHIRVDEAEGANVRVNLPISLAEVAADIAGKKALEEHDIEWDSEGDVTLDDIRRMWRELRDAGDTDFVQVQEGDETVRVYRRGDRVHVDVDEAGDETVRVEMPADLVDAILGTEGEELDISAAMKQLARSGHGELVRVRDGETSVRIWIDDRNQQGG